MDKPIFDTYETNMILELIQAEFKFKILLIIITGSQVVINKICC